MYYTEIIYIYTQKDHINNFYVFIKEFRWKRENFLDNFRITDSSIVTSSLSTNITILLLLSSQATPNTAICIFCGITFLWTYSERKKRCLH